MNKVIIFVCLCLGANAFAQNANSSLKNDIVSLSASVTRAVDQSNASADDLSKAKQLLSDALGLISGSHASFNSAECFQYAYTAYYRQLDSATSTDKATAICKNVEDIYVLTFLYPVYYKTLDASQSMDKAGAGAGLSSRGKLDIIQYAYSMYYKSLDAAQSADRAVNGVSKVNAGSLACVQQLYSTYYRSLDAVQSMDKALAGCASN